MSGYYSFTEPSSRQVAGASGQKVKYGGLYLPDYQAMHLPQNTRHEIVVIPSTSAPSFSGQFVCDLKMKNIVLHSVGLQFNLGSVSGISGGTSPCLNPAFFLPQRIDILVSGNVVQTVYANELFLLANLLVSDEERKLTNICAGDYSSAAQRNALTTANSSYFVPIKCFIDQIRPALLTENHQIQLRVFMNSLSDCFANNSATGVASMAINYCNLIARVSYLTPDVAQYRLTEMSKIPYQSLAHETRVGSFSIPSGVSSASLVLTPITGNIASLIFVVRPTASLVSSGAFAYTQISSFNILDSAGQSLVGGQPIPHALSVWLNSKFTKSTYTSENSLSTTNNNANVYIWSHSADMVATLRDGLALNSRRYQGSETLVVNFGSSLGAGVTLDLYSFSEIIIQQTPTGFNKISN